MQNEVMSHPNSRIHEIDGLRGIAILSVITFHWIIQPLTPILSNFRIKNILGLSAYGVDLFFVISGFLIGGILLKIGRKHSGMATFYVRRILRIWPLYYLLVGFVYFADRGPRVFTDIPYWSFFFFIFNFWESFGLKIHPVLGTLWSLAIEEQFYILGPLIFFFLRRNQLALITGLIIVLSPFLRLMLILNSSVDVWRFTPARLDGISLGILLAIIFSSSDIITVLLTKIRGLKTATLFFFVVTLISRSILPGLYWNSFGNTLIILSFGLSLTMVVLQSMTNQNNRVLNSTVLRYLGLRCYSIYLFHILFMLITRIIVENFMVGLVIQYVLTLGFAHLSWKYIEMPPIKLGRKLTY